MRSRTRGLIRCLEVLLLVALLVGVAEELEMLGAYAKVDYLSADDHDEDQMLEDVHELVLTFRVVLWETDLRQVLMLLDEVVIERRIPPKGLPQVEEEPLVVLHFDEAGSVGVVEGPAVSEVLAQIATHELAISLRRLMEGRQDDRYEQPQEDHAHQDCEGEEIQGGEEGGATAHWLVYIIC